MVHNQAPTRAEASDVANAILDGTDAVMLSAETAIGDYPVEAVATMHRIAEVAEAAPEGFWVQVQQDSPQGDFTAAIADAAEAAARSVSAKAVVAFTQSGWTARLLSKHTLRVPIIAVTPSEQVARRVALYRGVVPQVAPKPGTIDEMLDTVTESALQSGIVSTGDVILVVASASAAAIGGATNLIQMRKV
jgi:pyruvate kinase